MRTFCIVTCSLITCVQCVHAQVEVLTPQGDVRITVQFSPVREDPGALDNVPVKPLSKW